MKRNQHAYWLSFDVSVSDDCDPRNAIEEPCVVPLRVRVDAPSPQLAAVKLALVLDDLIRGKVGGGG